MRVQAIALAAVAPNPEIVTVDTYPYCPATALICAAMAALAATLFVEAEVTVGRFVTDTAFVVPGVV